MTSCPKILLFNPPGKKLYIRDCFCPSVAKVRYLMPPLDLLYQSAWLSPENHLMALDAIALSLSPENTLKEIARIRPDLVLFLTSSLSWDEDKEIMQRIKDDLHPVLLGMGDNLQFDAEGMMRRNRFLDGILLDMLSDSLREFLRNPGDPFPNLLYRRHNNIISGPRIRENRPFSLPPVRHELFPLDRYSLPLGKRGRWGCLTISTGCPYSCQFCTVPEMGFRLRDVDNIAGELEHLRALNVRNIFFRDSSFTNRSGQALAVLEQMRLRDFRFNWICHSRPDTVSPELLREMRDAGCRLIMFGVESGDEEMRRRYKTAMNDADLIEVFHTCRSLGIQTLAHFILGLPGETPDTIRKTIRFSRTLKSDFASFNIASSNSKPWNLEHGVPVFAAPELHRHYLRAVGSFYFHPGYLFRKLSGIRSPGEFLTQVSAGLSLLKQIGNFGTNSKHHEKKAG